jgi:hypothetical protein
MHLVQERVLLRRQALVQAALAAAGLGEDAWFGEQHGLVVVETCVRRPVHFRQRRHELRVVLAPCPRERRGVLGPIGRCGGDGLADTDVRVEEGGPPLHGEDRRDRPAGVGHQVDAAGVEALPQVVRRGEDVGHFPVQRERRGRFDRRVRTAAAAPVQGRDDEVRFQGSGQVGADRAAFGGSRRTGYEQQDGLPRVGSTDHQAEPMRPAGYGGQLRDAPSTRRCLDRRGAGGQDHRDGHQREHRRQNANESVPCVATEPPAPDRRITSRPPSQAGTVRGADEQRQQCQQPVDPPPGDHRQHTEHAQVRRVHGRAHSIDPGQLERAGEQHRRGSHRPPGPDQPAGPGADPQADDDAHQRRRHSERSPWREPARHRSPQDRPQQPTRDPYASPHVTCSSPR